MKTSGSASKTGVRNIIIAVVIIAIVGVGTFFGTSYLASVQLTSSQTGSTQTSESSGQGTSSVSSVQSTSSQSSVQTSETSASCSTPPVIALDGSAIDYSSQGNSSSLSVSLSTSKSPDVILVFTSVSSNPIGSRGVPPAVTNITDATSSLSFHKRGSTISSTVNGQNDTISEEEWYAVANVKLDNDSIKVSVAKADSTMTVIAFGVSGANTSSPFDSNPSLPGTSTGISQGTIQSAISTTNAYDFIVGGALMASVSQAAGNGYTLIQADQGKAPQYDPAAEYEAICVPTSDYQVSFVGAGAVGGGAYYTSTQSWVIIADALVQATTVP